MCGTELNHLSHLSYGQQVNGFVFQIGSPMKLLAVVDEGGQMSHFFAANAKCSFLSRPRSSSLGVGVAVLDWIIFVLAWCARPSDVPVQSCLVSTPMFTFFRGDCGLTRLGRPLSGWLECPPLTVRRRGEESPQKRRRKGRSAGKTEKEG